ncbi:hypothetical protein MAAFP003_3503 [Mycobacterium ahvazicum]|uniref:Cupin domain-containing protein n=1 Tax=Mycobacterium ahvazicum TaxID=1964395 RepID=A0A2K4YDG4_9MYCO|nr:hypothetical protein [Mycobacterium ahvazicum]SOX54824.1 hypothetical protein MAAFP003_3503 [Mycobacterium ahvazicum]
MTIVDKGTDFGVDWVDVTIEPHHVEQFGDADVRIYEATIAPGAATMFHRHTFDTLYVVTAGGRFRSEEPGRQKPGTRPGRSTPLLRQLGWLFARKVRGGWISMPTGTLIAQPHRTHPLIHRVVGNPGNAAPIRMLGVELHRDRPVSDVLPGGPGIRVENPGHPWPAYRLTGPAEGGPLEVTLAGGGVLVVVAGTATVEHNGQALGPGQAVRLPPGRHALGPGPMEAVLIPL